jgi:hypothetical protein
VKTAGIQPWPRRAELSSIEVLGRKSRDIASENNRKMCKCECPIKIRYIRDPREVICRVTYTTRDNILKFQFSNNWNVCYFDTF